MEKNWVDIMLDDLDEVDVIFKSVSDDVILGLYPWVKKELVEV